MSTDNSKPARRARASKTEQFDGAQNLSEQDAITLADGFVWTMINESDGENELADFLLLLRFLSECEARARESLYIHTRGEAGRFFSEMDQALDQILTRRHVALREQLSK